METINCPICSSTGINTFIELKDRFKINNKTFNLTKCECSLIYLNPRPKQEDIGKYYKDDKYSPHHNVSIFYKLAQSLSFFWKYKLIRKYSNKDTKVLDYGSGRGEFSNYLTERNVVVNSFEPILKTDKNTDVMKKNEYNIITLWHSLEHIHNLDKAFNDISLSIKDKGVLFIAIPNINAVEKYFFNNDWVAYDVPRHLYHFNEKSLNKLLNKYNFKILNSKPILQDTLYNIYLSIKSKNILMKLFKFTFISLTSLFIILLNSNKSSSKLYTCTKK